MNLISTIENFDGTDGFFGQVALLGKRSQPRRMLRYTKENIGLTK
jgi:hypothetical protein